MLQSMFRSLVRPHYRTKTTWLALLLVCLTAFVLYTSPYSSFSGSRQSQALHKENALQEHANKTLLELAPKYVKAILDPSDTTFPRLECPKLEHTRYDYLRGKQPSPSIPKSLPKYYFALDLHQCVDRLPRLIGTIVEAIHFLGPENCVLSIVEGRSTDGTYEVLLAARRQFEEAGIYYIFQYSELDPGKTERISTLANLRNLALAPLVANHKRFDENTTVIFLNDIAMCLEDVLELIHQKVYQKADMTCAMDWTYVGNDPTFYDIWIARTMNGETFFEIGADGNWNSAWNIFWNTPLAQSRYNNHKPFQVFSCWNGMTAFSAKPVVEEKIKFRSATKAECYQGEPRLWCKDMWRAGYGKIAVVPSINVEYSDDAARRIKELKGRVNQWVSKDGTADSDELIEWQKEPPKEVKCITDPDYAHQHFVPWNQGFES